MKKLPLKILCWLCAATLSAPALAQTILVFGDSLSAGYGIAREASWVSLLQKDLAQTHPAISVVNASISGETTAGGARRLAQALQQHQPSIVILELGANDGLRGTSLHDTEHNLRNMIEQVQQIHAKVLLLGMQLPPNYGRDYTQHFAELYPKLAQQYRIKLAPFMLDGLRAEEFQADNLHPTAAAQAHILHNILPWLKPLL
jgi:acyl-CoA thioesterase-1